MNKIIKKGVEKLPLVYQLADVEEIKSSSENILKKEIRPNRMMPLPKYVSKMSQAMDPGKPISKIL